jgi:AbrB family looped-hinge helix DNA binding protein
MKSYFSRLTSKGRMTLPLAVRSALGIEPGDYVRIEHKDDGSFELKPRKSVLRLAGSIETDQRLTVEGIRSDSRATFDP